MKNKKSNFPRPILKSLVEDINNLVESNEGKLLALEVMEEIPGEIRNDILEGLSSFYSPQMACFFNLLKLEYGKEYELIANRALAKYGLAGLNVNYAPPDKGDFHKAYASCSRHTGRMTLDVAWRTGKHSLYVECFFLTFSSDGIQSFFIIEDIPEKQYESDRGLLNDMVELSYADCCFLLADAYKLNVRYMSRPALGKFLYQQYLDEELDYTPSEVSLLLRKISARLTPRQLGNSFFHALRYQDYNYMLSILADDQTAQGSLFHQLNNAINPGNLLMEGQVEEVRASNDSAELKAFSITLHERKVYRNEYLIDLIKNTEGQWLISNLERLTEVQVETGSNWNPFTMPVYCRVYEIMDMDELFDVLDQVENIREVEELPYGMHMRVTCFNDDFNQGVSFMTGVIADLVINADEFVVVTQDKQVLDEFHLMFNDEYSYTLQQRGEYEISLANAYSYLSGQYANFEDILLNEDSDFAFEDGMRFITARYIVKDRDKVLHRLDGLKALQVVLHDDQKVYYELEDRLDNPGFFAEYILGNNWVTVSAFGDRDMTRIRHDFEENMYEALEFDGLELREDSIFTILNMEVKKQYPELESALKEMYLNKWYHSQLPTLRGMSPSEACQTEEGTRLLWTMFKRIKQKEKKRQIQGDIRRIGLKEYMNKVDL